MYQNFVHFCLIQAKISANGARKIILIERLNKIIFLAPLADIFAYFKSILMIFSENETYYFESFYLSSKCILIQEFLDIYTRKPDKKNHFFAACAELRV